MSAAIAHVLRRMQQDGRLAYLIGPGSQAFDLLTQEAAQAAGRDVAEYRQGFEATLRPEPWPTTLTPEPMNATSAVQDLGASIEHALDLAPVSEVLSVLTGAFVGLTVELVRRQGHDVSQPIKVDGGANRDVTVHPPKAIEHG